MIEQVQNDPELFSIIRTQCSENGIGINFCDDILEHDDFLDQKKVIVLKLDAYYCSQNMVNPPKSPDYLVIVKCNDGTFNLHIAELRNVSSTTGVRQKDIREKFETATIDFLTTRFGHYFNTPDVLYKKVQLLLITDPLGLALKNLTADQIKKFIRGTALDAYSSMKPIVFQNRALMIEVALPNPTICECESADA